MSAGRVPGDDEVPAVDGEFVVGDEPTMGDGLATGAVPGEGTAPEEEGAPETGREPEAEDTAEVANEVAADSLSDADKEPKVDAMPAPEAAPKPSMARRHGRYVASLDGLRAICCIGVVLYHMNLTWCQGGLLGVTVLFVLSGYLATAGLMREMVHTGRIDFRGYLKRRVWRLLPQVVAFLLVTACVTSVVDHVLFTKLRQDFLPALLGFLNWAKIFGNESYFAAAEAPSPLTHFWSLAIEWQFFLVWPPILYLILKRGTHKRQLERGLAIAIAVSALLMAVLYVPGADPSRTYYGTDTRAQSLLLGALLAVAWPMRRRSSQPLGTYSEQNRRYINVASVAAPALIVLLMVVTNGYSSFSYYGGTLLVSVIAAVALAALLVPRTWGERFFSFKPLAWIGKRSYAIYLWHYPIVEILNPRNATVPKAWWQIVLQLVLVIAVAEVSYELVEKPLAHGLGDLRGRLKPGNLRAALGSPRAKDPRKGDGRVHADKAHDARLHAAAPAGLSRREFAGVAAAAVLAVWTLVAMAVVPDAGAAAQTDQPVVMRASLKKPLVDGVYDVVLIGDSVSLGAHDNLAAEFPHGLMDTEGNRQVAAGIEALQGYMDQGVVGDTVVISLGTNGYLTDDDLDNIHTMVGDDRQLYFVNLRSPNAKDVDNNAAIDKIVAAYDNVHLIDWYSATQGHDEYLIADGIHLTWDGRDAYAALVKDTIGYEEPTDANTRYDVTFVGDDVALDAADQLASAFPQGAIDTADRTPKEATDKIREYVDADVVGDNVVIAMASDAILDKGSLEAMVEAAGDRQVWVYTARTAASFCSANNDAIKSVADAHDNVHVVDWYAASAGHDDYLASDGAHLTDAGKKVYAQLLVDAMGRTWGQTESGDAAGSDDAAGSADTSEG